MGLADIQLNYLSVLDAYYLECLFNSNISKQNETVTGQPPVTQATLFFFFLLIILSEIIMYNFNTIKLYLLQKK